MWDPLEREARERRTGGRRASGTDAYLPLGLGLNEQMGEREVVLGSTVGLLSHSLPTVPGGTPGLS